ncbi:3-deoxy-manno-octulosonate cytidylyltransferase [Acididesulfobacillus acetoxydans]|uniref:Cytidylyltransferase n=1 Tax=Acididesulfobacillus acetoxydans TaxID=1561005 RepID=A0A8S0WI83_9FIRM|nr:acylneuraminate cytidylyltransferase family protein [Acididesulfobacillus acetoxydans]CAA7603172.1 3-deoxy-manno-octulosonate cytidylyltransferase [Acididesulfobacillus acetoxydans]CEJ07600.1 Cytidylyltransferase [Acididesulfobacillus acetoxydans]
MAQTRILGIIPARGGSKGIPRKNIRLLGGKPLLAWTIEAALEAGCLDRLILTTEDEEIAAVGRKYGCEVPFLRPAELAQDSTPGIEPVLHALRWLAEREGYRPDYVLLLQPTSPLRRAEQIRECAARMLAKQFGSSEPGFSESVTAKSVSAELAAVKSVSADTVSAKSGPLIPPRPPVPPCDALVSVTEPDQPPEWMFRPGEDGFLRPLLPAEGAARRQELPATWVLNGALYLVRTEVLLRERTFMPARVEGFAMDRMSSLDLDSPWDWQMAECCLARKISPETLPRIR